MLDGQLAHARIGVGQDGFGRNDRRIAPHGAQQLVMDGALTALHALDAGMDGIVVSNHGGRQSDLAPAAVEALPAVVDAVAGRVPVILDGGVRGGGDVAVALALGAAAVGVGRPVLWGLAADGAAGVGRVLDLLRDEFDHVLALCGGRDPADLTRDLVVTRGTGVSARCG